MEKSLRLVAGEPGPVPNGSSNTCAGPDMIRSSLTGVALVTVLLLITRRTSSRASMSLASARLRKAGSNGVPLKSPPRSSTLVPGGHVSGSNGLSACIASGVAEERTMLACQVTATGPLSWPGATTLTSALPVYVVRWRKLDSSWTRVLAGSCSKRMSPPFALVIASSKRGEASPRKRSTAPWIQFAIGDSGRGASIVIGKRGTAAGADAGQLIGARPGRVLGLTRGGAIPACAGMAFLPSLAVQQVPLPEQHRCRAEVIAVGLLREAVALVVEHQEPRRVAAVADRGEDLLGLGVGHARVVPALGDEQRRLDAVGVVERRDVLEERRDLRIALVAVFGPAQVAAVALGIAQEGGEVGDADDVDAGADAVGVVHQRRQHHVAAVAAAGDAHAARIQLRLCRDPVQQGADVLHRILPQQPVVELQPGLAVAGGSAHVGHQYRHAQLVHQEREGRADAGPRLPLRVAVDVDHHRPAAVRRLALWQVVEGGDGARPAVDLVERRVADQG